MNSLEFINDRIRSYETMLLTAIDTKCSVEQIRHYKERLNIFYQIKTELEAWYIIKDVLELTVNELDEEEIEMKVFFTNAKVELNDTRKEFKKIKKALEVKND